MSPPWFPLQRRNCLQYEYNRFIPFQTNTDPLTTLDNFICVSDSCLRHPMRITDFRIWLGFTSNAAEIPKYHLQTLLQLYPLLTRSPVSV